MRTLSTHQLIRRFRKLGFSVSFPYNHDPELWGKVAAYRGVIEEVYAGLHPAVFPSARCWPREIGRQEHWARLQGLADQLGRDGVALNIVLNTAPSQSLVDMPMLLRQLAALRQRCRVRACVADLYWGMRLRRAFPDISLHGAVTARINCQAQAMPWRDLLGVDVVTIDRDINKNLPRIKSLRRMGLRLKMVASDGCLPYCPLSLYHIGIQSQQKREPAVSALECNVLCRYTRLSVPVWHYVKKEVLPFQLPRYQGAVDIIKLTDRARPTDANLATLERYLRMEDDVHPMFGYRESAATLDRLGRCGHDCDSCGFCREHIRTISPTAMDTPPDYREMLKAVFGVAGSSADPVIAPRMRSGRSQARGLP